VSVAEVIRSCLPDLDEAEYGRTLVDLGIDSFTLLELRLKLEQALNLTIFDADWVALDTIAALASHLEGRVGDTGAQAPATTAGIAAGRSCLLNMPQMALGGLSESWLFKQLGDLHWELICTGLGGRSHELVDGKGDRLYATFTRLRVESSHPMTAYGENETLEINGGLSRFGPGIYFSQTEGACRDKTIRATIMSSFAKRGSLTDNTSLLKGQPAIPPGCAIPELAEMPRFGLDYRDRRSGLVPPSLFETTYNIIPCHDINGVGLLYFAAYPSIADICELRYIGRGNRWAAQASTTSRDVCYFANCDMEDSILYRVHARRDGPGWVEIESSLTRLSDGRMMAYLVTTKGLIDG
jgi:probable biosynthetic protein (TIGR04098 family)